MLGAKRCARADHSERLPMIVRPPAALAAACTCLALAGCEVPTSTTTTVIAPQPAPPAAPTPPPAEAAAPQPVQPVAPLPEVVAGVSPIEDTPTGLDTLADPELTLVRGYRSPNDPCQIAGESRLTRRYLDDSSDLVACLTGGGAASTLVRDTGARAVAQTATYTLFSVPRG